MCVGGVGQGANGDVAEFQQVRDTRLGPKGRGGCQRRVQRWQHVVRQIRLNIILSPYQRCTESQTRLSAYLDSDTNKLQS